MSQTSIDRLKDYLGQLPPQAQALLMREFERAIERGEDTAVASLVLEQLRKVARGPGQGTSPRSRDAARLLFRALEPFLVEGNLPARPGQMRRASLSPVFQWLARDGAPEQMREYETTLANDDGGGLEVAIRKLQLAAADAIFKITAPSGGGTFCMCNPELPRPFSIKSYHDSSRNFLMLPGMQPPTISRSAARVIAT